MSVMNIFDIARAQEVFPLSFVSGLFAHQFFRRNEPNLVTFTIGYAAAFATLSSLWSHHQEVPLRVAVFWSTLSLAIHFLSLSISITLYRLSTFHPLASFPGPVSLKLSKFASYPWSFRGEGHRYVWKLHQKYASPYVRIGPNELSISDLSLLNSIYGVHGWDKGPVYSIVVAVKGGETALNYIPTHEEHAVRKRGGWDSAFTTGSVTEYLDLVKPRIAQFLSMMEQKVGKPVAINRLIGFCIWDIMLDLGFSGTEHAEMMKNQTDAHVGGVFSTITAFVRLAVVLGNTPWVGALAKMTPISPNAIAFIKYCNDKFRERLADAKGTARKDIFAHLVADLENPNFSGNRKKRLGQLDSDSLLLTIAGADTTSTTLTMWFYNVLSCPGLWQRLQQEIDELVQETGDDDFDPNFLASRAKLLEASINENMRFSAAVPYGPLQRICPPTGFVLPDGRFLPPGTKVVIPPHCLHRNPTYFWQPDRFIPDRWLPGWKAKHVPEALKVFSTGPMGCIGQRLAYHEMRLFTAGVLRRFNVTLHPSNKFDEASGRDWFVLQITENVMVQFTPRKI
ncbi:cytochrome P450 [Atractiella rhizophila]|nr:cytochrome P450 [Atractiella rhizophila]